MNHHFLPLLDFIQNSRALAVELETELTKRPALSPDSGGEGELDKCEFLEGWLRAHGLGNLRRIDIPDSRAKGGVRPNLILTIEGKAEGGARLWIISHTDVVPPGEAKLWAGDPWTVVEKDGKLYGRGVEDNQQGLVSSVLAALAFVENGLKPARTVKLLFVADEECGNKFGMDALLKLEQKSAEPLFREGDMALIPDGGDSKGQTIEIAEKNLVWAKFTTTGVQAHGSRPDLGANAALAGSALALALHEGLAAQFGETDALFNPPYSTFEPTKKEANVPNVNTIPGEDVFYMDMRILPRYPIKLVAGAIGRIACEIESAYHVNIVFEFLQSVESKPTAPDAPLVRLLSEKIRETLGVDARPIGIGGGTVGAALRNRGIDSVVWSPIDDTAHQPNEYALVQNILDGAKVMAAVMDTLLTTLPT
ncbi:MAG: M20 family metallo-hydrolase [Spirochaetaceae bacterium]|jgi:succinyl-diaminopimelate desuccinylase|nr:M20 family metallo-hydrolase [Spirochaetaceae bacterium]